MPNLQETIHQATISLHEGCDILSKAGGFIKTIDGLDHVINIFESCGNMIVLVQGTSQVMTMLTIIKA